MSIVSELNGVFVKLDGDPDKPLLWTIRELARLAEATVPNTNSIVVRD